MDANVVFGVASILAIAAAVQAARRWSTLRLCPICLGVAGTWVWMLAARFAGVAIDSTMLAILLGGSVAGTAQLLDRRLPAERSGPAFRTLFIPAGFVAAYGVAVADWLLFAGAAAGASMLAAYFLRPASPRGGESTVVADLERRMKDCC